MWTTGETSTRMHRTGRGLDYYDAPTVRQLVRDMARDGYRWSSLVFGIVNSQPFQMRRVPDSAVAGGTDPGRARPVNP